VSCHRRGGFDAIARRLSMSESVVTWMAVLESIEQSLASSLERTPDVPQAALRDASAQGDPLVRLDQRFEQWRASLERVERAASGSEGDLDADQKAVGEWLAAAAAAGKQLAARAQAGENGA
jgi:hypothetical protein